LCDDDDNNDDDDGVDDNNNKRLAWGPIEVSQNLRWGKGGLRKMKGLIM
jgi:hypothetical protein